MKCRTLNRRGYVTRAWHRAWCRTCRESQHLDTLIGFGLMQMQDEPMSRAGMAQTLASLDVGAGGKSVRRAARRVGLRQLARAARVGLLGLCGFGAWGAYMNYTPPLHIPAKSVPTPNAFDCFKQAGNAVMYDSEISDAMSPPDKHAKPGPRIRKQETQADPENPMKRHPVWRVYEHDHLYTLADRQFLLDTNRNALVTVRAGLHHPYMETYVRSFNTAFPHYTKFRSMARLLNLEAQVKAERGDWNGAMQSSLDSVELGAKIPRGAALIGRLVGIACEAIGRKQAWKTVEHLNRAQTQAALARLGAIRAEHVPFVDTMQEEVWGMQAGLREIMRGPNWRMQSFGLWTGEGDRPDWRGLLLYGWSNRAIIRDMDALNRENLRRAALPYHTARALPPVPEPFDPICRILFPVFEGARFQDVQGSEVKDDLLIVTLALHLYALDHAGAYPAALTELAPRYLVSVPADPFAPDNAPLRYRRMPVHDNWSSGTPQWDQEEAQRLERKKQPAYPGKDAYVLYSVGPDGKDNGGSPIDAAVYHPLDSAERVPANSPARYNVQQGSVGDIVAGLNGP